MITKVFHNLTLAEALEEIGSLGVRAIELGTAPSGSRGTTTC